MSNFRKTALLHIAGLLVSAAALAQAPSFTLFPIDTYDTDSRGLSISSDGRYISGTTVHSVSIVETVFRWDTQSAQVREFTTAVFFGASPNKAFVLDDGRVFWDVRFSFDPTASRIHLWDPISGQDTIMPGPAILENQEYIEDISRDGAFVLGKSVREFETTGSGYILDLSFPTPLRMPLNAGEGNVFRGGAGITLPINGARFAYGTVAGNSTVSGMSWIVPNPMPAVQPWEVLRISPKADYQIGKVGATFYLYGDGPGRLLGAPSNPFLFSGPQPVSLSDDGSTVVGYALHPFGYNEGVLWRKGSAPALLKTILTNAGVATPAWTASTLSDVTADGSTAVGSFTDTAGIRHAFRCILPAANDNCSTARAVTYGTIISSTNGATRAGVAGTCASEGNAPDIWFSFVPVANETVRIDTCGSNFDTTLAVFQASSCASVGAALACNDDAVPACDGNGVSSAVTMNVFAGLNYYIRVSGFNGTFGSVKLTITAPNRPSNDTCAQAADVQAGTGIPFSNVNAITDNRPSCGGTPFNDVWFKTVAPESGRMTFSTCGSTINTVMIVYDGSACGDVNAAPIACGSSNAGCPIVGGGNGTRITVPCSAGQTLLIRVGGLFGSSGSGYFFSTFACDQDAYSPYSLAVRNSGPIDYWRFDDSGARTAADAMRYDPYSCGNAPGEYIGNVNRTLNFQGKALNLDGSGAYARVWGTTGITDPNQCPGSFGGASMEAWIKTTDPQAGVVLTNRTNPSEHSLTMVVGYNPIGLHGVSGKLMFVSDGPGNFFGAVTRTRVDDGRWHHIVGRRIPQGDGTFSYEISVDDSTRDFVALTGTGSTLYGVPGAYWNIGNGPAWPLANAAFNGSIDEVAIYCGVLPDNDVINHYNIGRPCLPDVNFDHVVDFFDYLDFVSDFSAQTPNADFNLDGVVDFFDYLDFVQAFASGC